MLTQKRLRKIINSIVNEDKLLDSKYPYVKEISDELYEYTNCYAYALGICYSSKDRIYVPGFTTKKNYIEDSKDDLILKICEDLENLKISYRKFGLNDEIELFDNEYLVQVMYVPDHCDLWIKSAFHFSRLSKEGFWFSKSGWLNQPSLECIRVLGKEDSNEIVEVCSNNVIRKYVRIGYFAITEK